MFSDEELKFIRETIKYHTFEETTLMFNKQFKHATSISAIYRLCAVKKWKQLRKSQPVIHNAVIQWLADFYYTTYEAILSVVKRNKINARKLKELLESEDLINRRDEFYSMFKSENAADRLWVLIWDNERKSI